MPAKTCSGIWCEGCEAPAADCRALGINRTEPEEARRLLIGAVPYLSFTRTGEAQLRNDINAFLNRTNPDRRVAIEAVAVGTVANCPACGWPHYGPKCVTD